jgi:hypothetical protein
MSTPRQRAANRENAGASTGPRTAAGKARAAANARRHGLAISIWSDCQLSDTAETLARGIAGADSDTAGLAVSRRIAEAQVDLMRVRQARRDLLEREQDSSDVEPPREAMKEVNALIRFDELTEQGRPIPPELRRVLEQAMQRTKEPGTQEPAKFPSSSPLLAAQLAAIDRYERRALSRRNSAIRMFDAARAIAS